MEQQLDIVSKHMKEYNFVGLDTEFPKFLRNSHRNMSGDELYQIVKFNVDRHKLIQLGLTPFSGSSEPVLDANAKSCLSWQFNFREYNLVDDGLPTIRKSGIDLEKNMHDGIDACHFSSLLRDIVSTPYCGHVKWITFHGIYGIAYIVKLITQQPLPETLFDFLILAKSILGEFFDVKYLVRSCEGLLGGETSLKRLAYDLFDIRLFGGNLHQAGYDSLLTVAVFWSMKKFHNLREEQGSCILYDVEKHCIEVLLQQQLQQQRILVPIFSRFCIFRVPMRPRPLFPALLVGDIICPLVFTSTPCG